MPPALPFLWCVAIFLALGAAGVLWGRRDGARTLIYGVALLTSAVACGRAAMALLGGLEDVPVVLPLGLPWLGASFRVDALSAFFLVVINLGGAAASLFGLGYGAHERAPHRVLPFFPVFLAGMNLVLLADDAFVFLVAWEFMSLSSWALVMAHHRDPDNAHAGYLYVVMASFGTLSLLLTFGLLAGADGGYAFDMIRAERPSSGLGALILALALVGAGSKAGLVPLHVWLPLAHPAAPSHVSALMSGVMTKVAVYGFVRIAFDLLGEPDWQWGAAVLVMGGLTSALGILYAVMQSDLKRLLAYSTVENIGVIFIGLGLALAFRANEMIEAAGLAVAAALLHVFNHSLFKSLLFFGAGAVLNATGVRDMERLGGLIHRMPKTAFAFLLASAAISALPPLNGFVSEWLMFQAILLSPEVPQWLLRFLVPGVGALLALSAALAATCFVRAFGITFLGRARTPSAAEAKETDALSLAAMLALGAMCVAAGILPGLLLDVLTPVIADLSGGATLPEQATLPWLTLVPIEAERSSYNGLIVLLFISVSAVAAILAIHRFASKEARRAPAWDCGFPDPRTVTQYTASSFAQPIRRVFGTVVFRAAETVSMPPPGDVGAARFAVRLRDLAWDWFYRPLIAAVDVWATRLNHVQFLTIRRYLSLVFAVLVLLLVGIAIWR